MPELSWPDVEKLVWAWLTEHMAPVAVVTENESGSPTPRVRVGRAGGGDGRGSVGIDREVDIEVTVITDTRGDLWALADAVDGHMAAVACAETPHGYVDDVRTRAGFADDSPAHSPVRRASAVFTLTVRPLWA